MRKITINVALFLLLTFWCLPALSAGQPLPTASPEDVGMSSRHLVYLDELINKAIDNEEFPGAVLLVTRKGRIVYRRAFGLSQAVPRKRPMTCEMLFDVASITKPVATATSMMILVERGKLRLEDKVTDYVVNFLPFIQEKGIPGEDARLWHLLTHTSGLPPYADPEEVENAIGNPCTTADLVGYIAAIPKEVLPGKKFIYSCLNYITLAHIITVVTGQNLADFTSENVYRILGMTRTLFAPPAGLRDLCVPTEIVDGKALKGIVHDPLARLQGGISGNAGLFSTADDLAVFAQMMLGQGFHRGVRVLSPLSIERMTEIFPKVPQAGRGFGWDLASDYSSVRGDLFGNKSYGHSGYTGTSLWIDPESETAVVLLTNRVHPDDTGDIIALRSKVANIVAASIFEIASGGLPLK